MPDDIASFALENNERKLAEKKLADKKPSRIAHLFRRLPHSEDAEMAVIGGCITNPNVFDKVLLVGLEPEHFMASEHSRIFAKLCALKKTNAYIDTVTLGTFFETDHLISPLGGKEYLSRLVSCACSPVNGHGYAISLIDAAIKRRMVAIGEEMVDNAYASDMSEDASKVIEKTSAALFELAAKKHRKCKFKLVSDEVDSIFDNSQERLQRRLDGMPNGIDTGIRALDEFIGGMEGGDLVIVAGRPSMGKTTLATSIAHNAGLANVKVGMFSLETSGPSIVRHNFLARATGYPGSLLRNPDPKKISKEQLELARGKAKAYYRNMPIYISDTILSVQGMGSVLREEIRTRNIQLVIIDLISMVEPENNKVSLFEQTTQVCRGLKSLAKDLNVPFIVLCQLSRGVEMRDDKRPMLSDLRQSGEIEQAADIVMFVYREFYYLDRHKPKGMNDYDYEDAKASARNKVEVIVGKNRQGEIGTAHAYCDLKLAVISDIEHAGYPPAYRGDF